MTLTEQWKKGELEDGNYYIETDVGVKTAMISTIYPSQKIKLVKGFIPKGRVKQILAPIPSYQEYLESEAHCAVYSEENKQLRALLKECKDIIEWYKADTGYVDLPTENVLTRINAVIGESEE